MPSRQNAQVPSDQANGTMTVSPAFRATPLSLLMEQGLLAAPEPLAARRRHLWRGIWGAEVGLLRGGAVLVVGDVLAPVGRRVVVVDLVEG
jgi:hypothetical protein